MVKKQALRIETGWKVTWNTFNEVDPSPETIHEFQGSSLLTLYNENANRLIDLSWRPELDINGSFKLQVIATTEVFNEKTNTQEVDGNWERAFLEYESKSRLDVVAEIERLMLKLKPHKDPRILKKRGVVDEPSESLRKQLLKGGIKPKVVVDIIKLGNSKIQEILIDHKDVNKEILESLSMLGVKKGVKKKALQKLNSKAFKSKKTAK